MRQLADDKEDVQVANLYANADIYVWKNFCQYSIEYLVLVEDIGVEPMTLCVQGRCSSQLS